MNVRTPPLTLDAMAMARFLVMPDANRLLEAFVQIPLGDLRDSVIHHVEAIARTYQEHPQPWTAVAPVQAAQPAPAAPEPPPAPPPRPAQIASRTGNEPKTESRESRIVKLRIQGKAPATIAEELGVHVSTVYTALNHARAAGVPIPKRGADTPRLAGTNNHWTTSLDDLKPQGLRLVEKAAAARGITAQEYLDRRQLALKLAQEGAGWDTILEKTGETSAKNVSAWLSVARASGYNVPYIASTQVAAAESESAAQEPAQAPQAPAATDDAQAAQEAASGRIFADVKTLPPAASIRVHKAASRRGMSVTAYQEHREAIVRHRLEGKGVMQIAQLTRESRLFIRETIESAENRGVKFPPLAEEEANGGPPALQPAEV